MQAVFRGVACPCGLRGQICRRELPDSRFQVLHSVGLFLGGLEFISSASPFVVDCFWTNFIEFFSNLAEHIQILGGEDVSYCVFLLFSLSAMTQMIPEIVENPNKTTKWFVQFTLNVSIKTEILQRYYNTKERPACFFPFFPFDITTQLPFHVV